MTLKDEVHEDAHTGSLDEELEKFRDANVKGSIEDALDQEDVLENEDPHELILMAGLLKAIYLMERLEEERKTLRYRLFLNGDNSYEV